MSSPRRSLRRLVPLFLLATIVPFVGYTARDRGYILAAEPDMRVLFIGNSYTHGNDMPASMVARAGANGLNVDVEMIAPGGRTFRDHAADSTVRSGRSSSGVLAQLRTPRAGVLTLMAGY